MNKLFENWLLMRVLTAQLPGVALFLVILNWKTKIVAEVYDAKKEILDYLLFSSYLRFYIWRLEVRRASHAKYWSFEGRLNTFQIASLISIRFREEKL